MLKFGNFVKHFSVLIPTVNNKLLAINWFFFLIKGLF
jgi:hypothetical protein